ncbi:MAG: D-arabinono-1,4-lactone oxidase [Pseudomonadota bacterium]
MRDFVDTKWQNWSGNVQAIPSELAYPASISELQKTISETDGSVRVCGTGHSFTPVCETAGTLISLENLPGDVLRVDGNTARVQAGASLNAISKALQTRALAFKNLGDIDVQSLAGATMTATHGTGAEFPCLSAEIRSVKLIAADGSLVHANRETNPDLVRAASVSLGALGILVEAELSLRPAYKLHRRAEVATLAEILRDAEMLWSRHRNFEAYVLPFCDYALKLTHEEVSADTADFHRNAGDDDATVRQIRMLRNVTKHAPRLRRRIQNMVFKREQPEERVGWSWQLLASQRGVPFNEMEYHLPVENGIEAISEVLAFIERNRRDVFMPMELRRTAGDDLWLSPFQGAPRISVAVHTGAGEDYDWMIEKIEPIFRRYGGRPHWGKLHGLGARELTEIYPDFERFQALRAEMDPRGRFLNAHLSKLFGAAQTC